MIPPAVVRLTEPNHDRRLELLRTELERSFIPERGARYAIKPNLSSCRPPSTGATTDPVLVRVVVRHLQDHGASAVIVELPPHIRNIQRVVALTGYDELARKLGVALVIPETAGEFVTVGRVFGAAPCRVARAAWEADGIINLPKIKTHMRAHFTGAVKNLFGITDMATRHYIHVLGLHRGIAQLYRFLEPKIVLNLLDGVVAMQGQGPTRGDPLVANTLYLGEDAVRCDLAAAAGFGVAVSMAPYLEALAAERKLLPLSADDHAFQLVARAAPVCNPNPRADYLREALTTQPILRRLLQHIDFDFISDKRPIMPSEMAGEDLDHLCPHGAIRGTALLPERCTFCYDCQGDGSPMALEGGKEHKLRVLRDLLRIKK